MLNTGNGARGVMPDLTQSIPAACNNPMNMLLPMFAFATRSCLMADVIMSDVVCYAFMSDGVCLQRVCGKATTLAAPHRGAMWVEKRQINFYSVP